MLFGLSVQLDDNHILLRIFVSNAATNPPNQMHLTKRNPEINKPFVNPHSLTPQFPINEPNYDEWIDPEKKKTD